MTTPSRPNFAISSLSCHVAKLFKLGLAVFMIHAVSAAVSNSATAFETFKSLQGKWSIQSQGKTLPIEMTYEVGSKDSIVTEQFGKELSVIYWDGQSLLMTHFCNAGNAPRLRLKDSSQPRVLEFETFDVTNLKSADAPRVERIIYRIVDDKKMDLEIVWLEGKSERPEKYTLAKI